MRYRYGNTVVESDVELDSALFILEETEPEQEEPTEETEPEQEEPTEETEPEQEKPKRRRREKM